jgi:hypothetical protein
MERECRGRVLVQEVQGLAFLASYSEEDRVL